MVLKRVQSQPPARLKKLIDLVNLLPKKGQYAGPKDDIDAILAAAPKQLVDYVRSPDFESLGNLLTGTAAARYKELLIARFRLGEIAKMSEGESHAYSIPGDSFLVVDAINGEGNVRTEMDIFSRSIDGVSIFETGPRGERYNKIAVCPICDDVFWRKRSHARLCRKKRCKSAWFRLDPGTKKQYANERKRKRVQAKILKELGRERPKKRAAKRR